MSIESRVVPGRSCTTARSSPTSRLNKVDLPTLGRPTIATEKILSSGALAGVAVVVGSTSSAGGRQHRDERVEEVAAVAAVQRREGVRVAEAELGELPHRTFAALVVDLVGDHEHRHRRALQHARDRASSSVTPTVTSTTTTMTSASRIARSACPLTLAASPGSSSVRPDSPGSSQPPVSIRRNRRPRHSPTNSLRSRVTPGFSCTIASRRPTMRFTSVDFPTLGRPTTATTGNATLAMVVLSLAHALGHDTAVTSSGVLRERAHERRAVGGHRLDDPGQLGERHPVEEATLREHDIGQEVAVAFGFGREPGGEVGAGEEPGDADVAAEEPVGDGQQSHRDPRVVGEIVEQRREHRRAHLAGDDRDPPARLRPVPVDAAGARDAAR